MGNEEIHHWYVVRNGDLLLHLDFIMVMMTTMKMMMKKKKWFVLVEDVVGHQHPPPHPPPPPHLQVKKVFTSAKHPPVQNSVKDAVRDIVPLAIDYSSLVHYSILPPNNNNHHNRSVGGVPVVIVVRGIVVSSISIIVRGIV